MKNARAWPNNTNWYASTKEELDRFNQQRQVLESISKLTADEARDQLVQPMKEESPAKANPISKIS